MSSRAIRKLQRLREQELQRALSHEVTSDISEDEEESIGPSRTNVNAFDLLNIADEAENHSDGGLEETSVQPPELVSAPGVVTPEKPKRKKGGRKRKSTKSASTEGSVAPVSEVAELDEIDRALRDLAVGSKDGDSSTTVPSTGNFLFPREPEQLLSIEPKFLNATNEMRKLFGNVVFENFDQSEGIGARRRNRQPEAIDLGQALSGRYNPASRGQNLAGTTLRRNILMQGKDEWPRAPSGGLGMESVESLPIGPSTYRLIHNVAYQDVQKQFDMCVESMDPQRLIHLLQYNPYHISTLLQVSEIAKHQGDHAVAADLLERALFNIGRSAHSSFGSRVREGRARLDFIHTENREFWLVGWRYISNLGMKGTWRTAYEWAKLLLSLNTSDPYCIRLLIDSLALRGREYAHLVELCTQTKLSKEWEQLPNIQCSLVLAYLRLNRPKECREQLLLAMSHYPWVFCRLAQELDINPMPKQIWGKMPPADSHELLTELYISRAKDLWNTPESISLLVEVADSLVIGEKEAEPPEITLDIARHVVLSDIARVTSFLPGRFVSGRISASDPLPPFESEAFHQQSDPVPSYLQHIPGIERPQWLHDLLDQLNNGALHFPRLRGEDTNDVDDDDVSSHEDMTSHNVPENPSSPAGDQSLVRWLLGDGLHALEAFLRQNGIDRGNWGDEADCSALTEYVHALSMISSVSALWELLNGPIREAMGDMAVDLLDAELHTLRDGRVVNM